MESNTMNDAAVTTVGNVDTLADAAIVAESELSEPPNAAPSAESDGSSSSSDDASDIAIADKDINDDDDPDLQATPGHLHALANRKSPARLLPKVHSDSKLADKLYSPAAAHHNQRRRSASRSVNSSRSSSPSHQSHTTNNNSIPRSGSVGLMMMSSDNFPSTTATNTSKDATSSSINNTSAAASYASSSLDGKFDPDLLLDRLGFIDLDPPLPHEIRCGPLAAPGSIDGKSNNAGGLTPVNERLCDETLEDCHAFQDLVFVDYNKIGGNGMSSTMSMPSVAHSSLSGMRSDMSVGSIGSALSMGSFTKGGSSAVVGNVTGGLCSREGSVAGGSCVGDGELSVLLGTLDEVGEEEEGSMGSR